MSKNFGNIYVTEDFVMQNYIADFICYEKRIVIELDGSGHLEQKQYEYDRKRDDFFIQQGYTVLRFYNNELSNNFEGVMDTIYKAVN